MTLLCKTIGLQVVFSHDIKEIARSPLLLISGYSSEVLPGISGFGALN